MPYSLEAVNIFPYMATEILQMGLRWPKNRETILDFPGGPSVNTWALKNGREKHDDWFGEKKQCKRGQERSEVWEALDLSLLALKMGAQDHKPKNTDSLQKP